MDISVNDMVVEMSAMVRLLLTLLLRPCAMDGYFPYHMGTAAMAKLTMMLTRSVATEICK